MTLSGQNLILAKRLTDVSVAFEQGEITAICGPNGAGKSTLLQGMAGLLSFDSGQAMLDDTPLALLAPRDRAKRIGYLPQDGQIAWDVSVRNLVQLGRLPHGDIGEKAVDRAIEALDLHGLQSRPISQVSGGERARVLLARVLAGEPDWILADEPLAALDLAHQLALLRHLRLQADAGRGVVIVLHDLALARNHADRVIVLSNGALAADGPPDIALSPEVLRAVWGVEATWLSDGGQQALVARPGV
ncbi:Vitamin B12-transporting ATPase [Alteripontixanthobacter maritimus]|uniref:Vitamin B12-transporting ATPase n=1 Tax=Alteripontixanthobacter maritimus TaxID=2161824 RepID=A0A369Q5S9_9SPHN|nr:ABC transporter ATP-binding protein [Alteripontixanthobacter maritimus]RDC60243.1 Vitamin B12-transporting ATPase [Alteripontixanthobacter maritimus]